MVRLTFMDVSKLGEDAYKKMCACLCEERLKKTEAVKDFKDRLLSAAAGYLLHCALNKEGITPTTFTYNDCGKPYLADGGVYFNLSHSGDIAVCALSDREVGVDVQKTVPVKNGLLKRVCTPSEYSFVTDGEEGAEGRFCRLWTVKESLIKCLGKGLALSPSRIEVGLTQPLTATIDGAPCNLHFKEYELNGYNIAVCSPADDFPPDLTEVGIE